MHFFDGTINSAIIEGILPIIEAKKQKKSSVCLEKRVYHFIKTSEIHQKFGTLS